MCGIAESFSAIGAVVQGQQAAKQQATQAAWSDAEAGYLQRKASWDRARRSEQNLGQIGGLLAQRAGSGATLSGSAIDALMSNLFLARANEIDGELGGQMASANAQAGARLSRMQATQALTGSSFQAGSTLLQGASNRGWVTSAFFS